MKKTSIVLSTLLSIVSCSAFAGLFGPSNYEECVLERLKDAKSEYSAKLVQAMCLERFSKNSGGQAPLASLESAHLICHAPKNPDMGPWTFYFNIERKEFIFNNQSLKTTGVTKDKIFASGQENKVIFNRVTSAISLTYNNNTSELSCDLSTNR